MLYKSKQKLWIVSELFPPDETSTSYILGKIANSFVAKYQVNVICGPEIYDKHKKVDLNNQFFVDPSIEVYRVEGVDLDKNTTKGKILAFILMSKRIISLVKQKVRKEDKVLMVTNPAPLVVLMSRLKKKVDFEFNILVHDLFPENTISAGFKIPMYGFLKKTFDKAYSKADQLIVLGRDMKEVLQEKVVKYNNRLKIKIIENWADVININPQPFPKGKIVVQYAGNIGRVQGLDKVIQGLPKDVEFHIYGTGSMEKTLKEMNHPRVYFHGPYFRSQQNNILSACDIAIVTLEENMYGLGVPSKTYNIMAAGRPILFFGPENSEIDLLVKEKSIGYCGWPLTWNKEELSELGVRARKIAVNEYSEQIILNKFLNAI